MTAAEEPSLSRGLAASLPGGGTLKVGDETRARTHFKSHETPPEMTSHLFPWLLLGALVIAALIRSLTSGGAKRRTRMARNDYRDVIAAAEYGDGEMGSRILQEFREPRPDNAFNLDIKELLEEE